ncbi:MAG: hypothetical protein AAGH40_12695 [Verrucomicrobiota bacterium]
MKNVISKGNHTSKTNEFLGPIFAVLLLRIWIGMRSLQAGIEKFAGKEELLSPVFVDGKPDENGLEVIKATKVYSFDNYSGVPGPLYDKFLEEPLIHWSMLRLYDLTLGPALLILGLCVLLGFATRISLLVLGLLYTSLTFGLILLNESSGVAWLAAHIILIVLMLFNVEHNRLEIGQMIGKRFGLNVLINK